MDPCTDVPPLLESAEPTLPQHLSFHESSTNVSIADSAAATLGSESFRDCSDRGLQSSNSSSASDESDDDSSVESVGNSNKISPGPGAEGFIESDMSTDEDWVEEANENNQMNNIKYYPCLRTYRTFDKIALLLQVPLLYRML